MLYLGIGMTMGKIDVIVSYVKAFRSISRTSFVELPYQFPFENSEVFQYRFSNLIHNYSNTQTGEFLVEVEDFLNSDLELFKSLGYTQKHGYSVKILENSQNIDLVAGKYSVNFLKEKIITSKLRIAVALSIFMNSLK